MTPPINLQHRKFSRRVILHTTSSSKTKDWYPSKYIALARKLQKKGYEPIAVFSQRERDNVVIFKEKNIATFVFSSLSELAAIIYEAGYFIGNDSGPGHLASYLQIPLLTISPLKSISHWQPGWKESCIIKPPSYLVNVKGFRLKENFWQPFVTVREVFTRFEALTKNSI